MSYEKEPLGLSPVEKLFFGGLGASALILLSYLVYSNVSAWLDLFN